MLSMNGTQDESVAVAKIIMWINHVYRLIVNFGAIIQLLDEELAKRLGKNSRLRVKKEFCWKKVEDRLMSYLGRMGVQNE